MGIEISRQRINLIMWDVLRECRNVENMEILKMNFTETCHFHKIMKIN